MSTEEEKYMGWQPNLEKSDYIERIFATLPKADAKTHRALYEEIAKLKAEPDFALYMLYSLHRNPPPPPEIRAHCSVMLKNQLNDHYDGLDPQTKSFYTQEVVGLLGDHDKIVRTTIAEAVTFLGEQAQLEGWGAVLMHMIHMIEQGGFDRDGAVLALARLSSVCAREMESESFPQLLETLLPRLIETLGDESINVRVNSLQALSAFLDTLPKAFSDNFATYFQYVMELARSDQSNEMKKRLCENFELLIQAPGALEHANDIFVYIATLCTDRDELVAQAAMDFWPTYLNAVLKRKDMAEDEKKQRLELLRPLLPDLIPVIMQGCIYTKSDIALRQADAAMRNRTQDEAYRPYTGKHVAEEAEPEGEDEFDEDEEWSLRKAAALSLDRLSAAYHGDILPVITPLLNVCFESDDWKVKESGILAIGAISFGCYKYLADELPKLLPYILSYCGSTEPLLQSVACWALGCYSKFISSQGELLGPVLEGMFTGILSDDRYVQEAACSAFSTLQEVAKTATLPYMVTILQGLMSAMGKYKTRNMSVLLDAIMTISRSVGRHLNKPEYIDFLLPPLLDKWGTTSNESFLMMDLIDCTARVVEAVGPGFLNEAPRTFTFVMEMLQHNHDRARKLEELRMFEEADDNKQFIICCMNFLCGLSTGIGASLEQLIAGTPLLGIMQSCLIDSSPRIVQVVCGLTGDLVSSCLGSMGEYLQVFIPRALELISADPAAERVCNNACWALGEMAIRVGSGVAEMVPSLFNKIVPLVMASEDDVSAMLHLSAAATMARFSLVCPDKVAPELAQFATVWMDWLGDMTEMTEKGIGYRGLCAVIVLNPAAVLDPAPFEKLCLLAAKTKLPPTALEAFKDVLHGLKALAGDKWDDLTRSVGQGTLYALKTHYDL